MTGSATQRLLCIFAFLALPALAIAGDPITIKDMLNAQTLNSEGVGADFSPDGHDLAYTVNAAPTQRPTWGYEDAILQTRARVFVTVDGSAPREIVGTPKLLYSLVAVDPWAPDSSGLLLIATTPGSYGLAWYELDSGKITHLPGRIDNNFIPTFAWLPDGRIVYVTIPDGMPQARSDGQILAGLQARWNTTWTGRGAPVTVHSANPVFAGTKEETDSLMLGDPRTGTARKLADGDYVSLSVAPSGRYIAAIIEDGATRSPASWSGRREELQILELGPNGVKLVHQLDDIDIAAFDKPSWSPSGRFVAVVGRPHETEATDARLYLVDAASGKYREVDSKGLSLEKVSPDIGVYPIGWLGGHPVAIAAHKVKGTGGPATKGLAGATTYEYGQGRNLRTDLFVFGGAQPENLTAFAKRPIRDFVITDDGSLLVVTDGALWKVAPGKPRRRLTASNPVPVLGFGIDHLNPSPPAQTAYYHKGNVERVSLLVLANGRPERATFDLRSKAFLPQFGGNDIVVTAPDRRTVLTRVDDGWVSSLVLVRGDGTKQKLVTVNADLKDKEIAPIEKFTYTVGKRKLDGFVLWPPGAKKNVKLPAVVEVYGGTVYGNRPPMFSRPRADISPVFSGQLLAAEGYAVIYPSTPLGRGADSDQRAQLAKAVVAAIDALAKGGRIDPQRVGVMGQSYGGFSTAALLSERSDRFKAGVSLAGLYDFFHAWGARPFVKTFSDDPLTMVYAEIEEKSQAQLGKPFWQAPQAYIRNSPIFHVDTLNSPLLMLHGDLDLGATDLEAAERMYTALLYAGKKPVLVHYWGEGHVAQSAAAMRDQWMRITTWFGHYLKGVQQPKGK